MTGGKHDNNGTSGLSRRMNRNPASNADDEISVSELMRIIRNAIVRVQLHKQNEVFGGGELSVSVRLLDALFEKASKLEMLPEDENRSRAFRTLMLEVAAAFRQFGADSISDLLDVVCGKRFRIEAQQTFDVARYEVLSNHARPMGYKIMAWKPDSKRGESRPLRKNRIVEDWMIAESARDLDCFDLARTSASFPLKVYGLKFAIQQPQLRRTIIVSATVDDVPLKCANYDFVVRRLRELTENIPSDPDFEGETFPKFKDSITLKECLVYDDQELYTRFTGYMNQVVLIKQKTIQQVTKEFLANELYGQRNTLVQLLLRSNEREYQYLAYLLYDLLSSDANGTIDTREQALLFDSLPWNVKQYFREAMRQTITYTNELANFENSRIPLEQQICLLKAGDDVKEKAMQKLKEVKSKSEDSGSKARQFLEGLLRIPFGIYREEPVLKIIKECVTTFDDMVRSITNAGLPPPSFKVKETYTPMDMRKYTSLLREQYLSSGSTSFLGQIEAYLLSAKRHTLIGHVCAANALIKKKSIDYPRLKHSGCRVNEMKDSLIAFAESFRGDATIMGELGALCGVPKAVQTCFSSLSKGLDDIQKRTSEVCEYMTNARGILDNAVHGHPEAKRQIERIIGQWANGEKAGYCFGFEGPPGVGKTSLAKKGISNCLQDEDGTPRPFAFIAIGGSSNGSTLDGHNYTYVGSTWGRIAEILMDKKCMNPIIFIDELDKVSRTEHGREIIGILTHLIDPTQNDVFEDKYFSGVELDLSKALFIFSYNDVSAIDSVLLDRIHRIKFQHLSLEDKLIVSRKHLLPEILGNMGLGDEVHVSDETLSYIIDRYTAEPGVRKLREILFEVIGEINLDILRSCEPPEMPIEITADDIRTKYLKDRHEVKPQNIGSSPRIGVVNGLWANAAGLGGVLPIEARYCPGATAHELKLTGMQGDVMKESMTVARTVAWSLLSDAERTETNEKFESTPMKGIHIHVPDGATPKDGPSGGAAITLALYSVMSERPINNKIAMTGEISLQQRVTAIGGLGLKIGGGVRAGITKFLYPKENAKDFDEFWEKHSDDAAYKDIQFVPVETIQDVIKEAMDPQ